MLMWIPSPCSFSNLTLSKRYRNDHLYSYILILISTTAQSRSYLLKRSSLDRYANTFWTDTFNVRYDFIIILESSGPKYSLNRAGWLLLCIIDCTSAILALLMCCKIFPSCDHRWPVHWRQRLSPQLDTAVTITANNRPELVFFCKASHWNHRSVPFLLRIIHFFNKIYPVSFHREIRCCDCNAI